MFTTSLAFLGNPPKLQPDNPSKKPGEAELLRARAENALLSKPSAKRREAKWRAFELYCGPRGLDAHRPSYDSVAGFLCAHVARCRSALSIDNVLSQVRVAARQRRLQWLDDADCDRLRALVAELKRADTASSQRKRPIRFDDLLAMAKHWNLDSRADLRIATMFTLAFQGLLRSGELLSGLRAGDIKWNPDRTSFQLWLRRTKTVRSGPGVYIGFKKRTGWFVGDLLRKWFDMEKLWDKPTALLFPSPKVDKNGQARTYSTSWFRRQVKLAVSSIGLDPSEYSGHSFRAGGATELFARGLGYEQIKKFGRWKSDAALIYYRDQDHIDAAVAGAFAAAEKEWAQYQG